MSAFADLGELVNRMTGGNSGNPQNLFWHKESRVAGAAAAAPIIGQNISLWEYEGSPSHGAVPPSSVAIPTNATQGSWKQVDAGGGRQLWIPAIGGDSSQAGTFVLYDRLLHISGLSGTVTTAQTVGGALTRNTGGVGNFIAAEIYTQIGVTGTTITASYTNQAAASGQTSAAVAFGNTNKREAQRMIEFSLAAGDTGVQAVASVTVLATTGTAGNFGIVVGRKLASFVVSSAAITDVRSFLNGPMMLADAGACLSWYWVPTTANAGALIDMWGVAVER